MRSIPLFIPLLALAPTLAFGLPGDIASGPVVTMERDAVIDGVSIAADGAVAVAGDFFAINGVASPGISVLNADGSVRTSFRAVPDSDIPRLRGFVTIGGGGTTFAMTWLDASRLLLTSSQIPPDGPPWRLLDSTGAVLPNPFPGVSPLDTMQPVSFANGGLVAVTRPTTVADGMPYMQRLRRLLLQTGRDDPAFNANLSAPHNIQAVTSADGTHWWVRRTPGEGIFDFRFLIFD